MVCGLLTAKEESERRKAFYGEKRLAIGKSSTVLYEQFGEIKYKYIKESFGTEDII